VIITAAEVVPKVWFVHEWKQQQRRKKTTQAKAENVFSLIFTLLPG